MKAKYALRAITALAQSGDARVHAHQLATRCRIPMKFLETILVELRQAGFVRSQRGHQGGHMLARAAHEIMIGDVIRTIDGPLAPVRCASITAYEPCRDCPSPDACALRTLMREARDALSGVLDHRSLREFADADAALSPVLRESA